MIKYIFQRIFFAIIALFVISIFVFVLISAFANNPAQTLAEALVQSGGARGQSYEEILNRFQIQMGIGRLLDPNDPYSFVKFSIIERYIIYMTKVFQGDFGFVINPANNPDPQQYTDLFKYFFIPLKFTIFITAPSMLMSLVSGFTIGIIAGYKRGKIFDNVSRLFVMFFVAVPSFILAPLVIVIGLKIGISPTVKDVNDFAFNEVFVSYLPPIFVVTITSLAGYSISSRNMVITVLTSNYVLIAKTKGLNSINIFFKYVLRNISIPLVGIFFGSFLALLSGSVVIEQYWNVKGTSQVIVNSFSTGEINVIMFSTLFFTVIGLTTEILIDLAYVILDPKITYATKSKKNYSLFIKAFIERQKIIHYLKKSKQLVNKESN
ncbi:ABC transporter permease [Mycoplasma sp. 1018B]|uniref:ABC transporter permease n=1 Tax=Mycoplasma sp. 1018B TaxID=2967302 RepID=UPI00211BC4E9|nr:ABC transporter permease [Mycoplasma sp. 1018B]UUM19400.1 ABC transporter permease [Mycoplasma sp. 1018B]